jgi:hypothetical protein
MPVGALLTKRDLEILEALTHKVRVLSLDQIARTWWEKSAAARRVAGGRLRILAEDGLLHVEHAPAHPELALERPVAVWQPTGAPPDFGAISYRLKSRWKNHPVRTTCVSASKTAANRFGGHGGRLPREIERTHDIHMAQVYLLYRLREPELLPDWVFEERIKSERRRGSRRSTPGEKLPDAILRSSSGTKVVEFGGAYEKEKLMAFHSYCKDHSFSYEIW